MLNLEVVAEECRFRRDLLMRHKLHVTYVPAKNGREEVTIQESFSNEISVPWLQFSNMLPVAQVRQYHFWHNSPWTLIMLYKS